MTFVGDDQAVTHGEGADFLVAGQSLQGGDVDGPAELRPAAAKLPGRDPEMVTDAGPPELRAYGSCSGPGAAR
jgi:hypothetical protein